MGWSTDNCPLRIRPLWINASATVDNREFGASSGMTFLRIVIPLYFLFEHDLFGKPVPTFPDHALGLRPHWSSSRRAQGVDWPELIYAGNFAAHLFAQTPSGTRSA
jgi:hypothetical protein